MCGIAGYIGKKQIGKNAINETLGLMKNRGRVTRTGALLLLTMPMFICCIAV